MARSKVTLGDWIQEAVNDGESEHSTKDGKCTAIALMHLQGMSEIEVHAVKFGSASWTPIQLGTLFLHKATTYSQELAGTQTFCLVAYYGESKEGAARHPFRIVGELMHEGLGTEAPTPAGKDQQAMRLTELIVQGAFRKDAITFDTLLRTVDTLSRQSNQTLSQNALLFEMFKEITIENVKLTHDYKMKEALRQDISAGLKQLPGIVNNALGKPIFSENTNDTILFERLLETMNEEQAKGILSHLPPEVAPAFIARLTQLAEKKNQDARIGRKVAASDIAEEKEVASVIESSSE